MIDYRVSDFAADVGALPPRAPCLAAADPVQKLATAMIELEAEGATVDAAALQVRTKLSRRLIDDLAEAARERAYALQRRTTRVRIPATEAATAARRPSGALSGARAEGPTA